MAAYRIADRFVRVTWTADNNSSANNCVLVTKSQSKHSGSYSTRSQGNVGDFTWIGHFFSWYFVQLFVAMLTFLSGNFLAFFGGDFKLASVSFSAFSVHFHLFGLLRRSFVRKAKPFRSLFGCELLFSFFPGGLMSRYWFFWEVPRIFERWSCCGDGWFIGWGMRIATVQAGLTLIELNVRILELFNIWCCSLSATSLLIFAFVFCFFCCFVFRCLFCYGVSFVFCRFA